MGLLYTQRLHYIGLSIVLEEKKTQHRRSNKQAERRKAEIEQKRQTKASSGIMRLGAKKVAKD